MSIRAATVWAVRLGAGTDDVEGTLALDPPDLRFTTDGGDLRIPLNQIAKVRRVRGSAVLIVEHDDGARSRTRYAFFFVKPPPLKPEPGKSKRKLKRQSILYLQLQGRERKHQLRDWERALRDAARA